MIFPLTNSKKRVYTILKALTGRSNVRTLSREIAPRLKEQSEKDGREYHPRALCRTDPRGRSKQRRIPALKGRRFRSTTVPKTSLSGGLMTAIRVEPRCLSPPL